MASMTNYILLMNTEIDGVRHDGKYIMSCASHEVAEAFIEPYVARNSVRYYKDYNPREMRDYYYLEDKDGATINAYFIIIERPVLDDLSDIPEYVLYAPEV